MDFKNFVVNLFGYSGPPSSSPFSLDETEIEQQLAQDGDIKGDFPTASRPSPKEQKKQQKSPAEDYGNIHTDLNKNKQFLEKVFHLPDNKDVVIRDFILATKPAIKAFAIFTDSMVDNQTINNSILQPLMVLANIEPKMGVNVKTCQRVLESYLPSSQVLELKSYKDVIPEVASGSTVLFFDGFECCLSAETRGFAQRTVGTARAEQVVQGPQEGFIENLQSNICLVRKYFHSPDLVTEMFKVGTRSQTNVAVMYMADIANPKLIQEVRRRISEVKIDYMSDSGMLEELIEDHPFSLIPQVLRTERPDRVASMLVEGRVAIMIANNPFVIIAPITFFSFLHSSEDYYVRFLYGVWLRMLRVISIFLAILLPSIYVAVATFNQEMIPTDLLMSIIAAKERVPFPTIVEILFMELAFELIREAGVRIPGLIGPTLGIVGTLILGQAAVSAAIVSPILIVIVAVTGLASFAIPNHQVAFGFRSLRFIFIFLAANLGFFGISIGLFVLLCMLVNMRSFGVPFFAPVAPRTAPNTDLILRMPLLTQEQRPDFIQPQDTQRQPNFSRKWTKRKDKDRQKRERKGD